MNYLIIDELDWGKVDGLMPAIVQDAKTQAVLMLGYMNQEAVKATLETQLVTFYSRSKQRLWTKGETSSNFLKLVQIIPDCDNDALLILANPCGKTCHLGSETCFGDSIESSFHFLSRLEAIIDERYENRESNSYTSELFDAGISRIAQKVGEEGVEVALAAVTEPKETLANECADLLFHLLVLLKKSDLTLTDVMDVLEQRNR